MDYVRNKNEIYIYIQNLREFLKENDVLSYQKKYSTVKQFKVKSQYWRKHLIMSFVAQK